MLVTKAMHVVMKLLAIWVATRKRHVHAHILKPVSFKLDFGESICSCRILILGSSSEKLKPGSLSLFDTDPLVCLLPWPRVNRVIEGLPEFKALGQKSYSYDLSSPSLYFDSVQSDSRIPSFTHKHAGKVRNLAKFGQVAWWFGATWGSCGRAEPALAQLGDLE